MRSYMVLSLIGNDKPGIVEMVAQRIYEGGCSLADSRMSVLGGEFAMIVLISGPSDALARTRASLSSVASEEGFLVTIKETDASTTAPVRGTSMRFNVEVVGMDHEGITYAFSNALAKRGVNVDTLDIHTMAAPVSGSPLFTLKMQITVPASLPPSELRSLLEALGEDHNVDVTVEAASHS